MRSLACFRPSFSVYMHKSNNIVFVLKIDRSIQSSIFMNANIYINTSIADGADRSIIYILLQQKYCARMNDGAGPGKESLEGDQCIYGQHTIIYRYSSIAE